MNDLNKKSNSKNPDHRARANPHPPRLPDVQEVLRVARSEVLGLQIGKRLF